MSRQQKEKKMDNQDQIETTPVESLEATPERLEKLETKANEYLEGWQRSLADFANYKKRVERDQAQAYQNAAGSILKKFLDAIDDLERALKNRPQEKDGADWANGIELIHRKLISAMEAEGVTVMNTDGQIFDPNLHEAVTHEEAEGFSEGQIIEVVKQGYLLGERVLRPALVRVAK